MRCEAATEALKQRGHQLRVLTSNHGINTEQRDPDYQRLLAALDAEPAALDELVGRTGLAPAALSSMLLVLELDGAVSAENGRYARR